MVPRVAEESVTQLVQIGLQGAVPFLLLAMFTEFIFDLGDIRLKLVPFPVPLPHGLFIDRTAVRPSVEDHLVGRSPVAEPVDVLEEGQEPVVILLRNRVELVIVAAGAVDGQSEEDLPGRRHDVIERVVPRLFAVARLVVPDPQPVEPGRNPGVVVAVGQLVSGQLLANEAVERLVVVQRADNIVAIAPGIGLWVIPLVAIGLGGAARSSQCRAHFLAVLG